MDNGDFYKEMIAFRGKTEESLTNICKDIKEIKNDLKEYVKNAHAISTDIQVLKGKAGIIATVVAFFTSIIVAVIGWLIRGNK